MAKAKFARASSSLKKWSAQPSGSLDSLLALLDSVVGPLVFVFTLWAVTIYHEGEILPEYLLLSTLVFALSFPVHGRLQCSKTSMITDIVFNWLMIGGLLVLVGFATGYIRYFSSDVLITWGWVAPTTEIATYLALRVTAPWLLDLKGAPQRAVIVGMNEQGIALAGKIRQSHYCRIDLVGFIDSRGPDRIDMSTGYTLLDKLDNLAEIVRAQNIQLIYLSLPMASQPRILQLLDQLKDTTASIYFVPDMFVTDLIQGHASSVCGTPVISVCETPFKGANGFVKRSSDIVFSILILTLISPLLIAIAIAVKTTSPGAIIFKQRRYGLDGEEILVYKFRSMSVTEDGGAIKQAQKNDARITPLGGFLRRTSLDELPQFINVLQGRMSIVGPRPHAVAHNELYRKLIKGYMVRHKVKPGITGWAQVNGYRGETDTLEKMQGRIDYDLDYLRNWSLQLDIHIILRTVRLVANDSQAY